MATLSPKEKEKAFYTQLQRLSFLVADPSPARNGIRGLLSNLGVKPGQIQVVEELAGAIGMIERHKPHVIFCDIALMANQAAELVAAQKSALGGSLPRVLCLLASGEANTGNSDAIEDDVDAVIFKPFTLDGLKVAVTQLLDEKLNPPPFLVLMDEGKQFSQIGKKEEALGRFQKAKALNPKSAVAGNYQATMYFQLGKLVEARTAFLENLKLNPTHYPSLIGLMDVYLKEENLPEAYKIGREIVANHPIPIKRLPDLIRLSILNASFEDISGFYKVSDAIQQSSADVAMHLASALVVAGLHFLKVAKKDAALDCFRKAEVMGKGNVRILKRILIALITKGMSTELKAFMMRASDEVKNSTELKMAELDFLLSQEDKTDALNMAVTLAQKNFPDPKVYHTAIELSIEAKRKATATKGIISIAVRAFPDQEDAFRAYEPRLPKE